MSELAFDVRLAQAGLVVDPLTARVPVALGGSTYAIEVHETADGCLLRCDVESPGTSLAKYADALNQIGHGEPGETEVVVAPNRLTVVRHLHDTTSDDLRSATRRIAGTMQMAEEIVAMLRTADAAEERLAKAPIGKFPDLQPALNALGTMSVAGPTTVGVPATPAASVRGAPSAAVRKKAMGVRRRLLIGLVGAIILVGTLATLNYLNHPSSQTGSAAAAQFWSDYRAMDSQDRIDITHQDSRVVATSRAGIHARIALHKSFDKQVAAIVFPASAGADKQKVLATDATLEQDLAALAANRNNPGQYNALLGTVATAEAAVLTAALTLSVD